MPMRTVLLDGGRKTAVDFDGCSISAALRQVCRSQHLPPLPQEPTYPDPDERRRYPRLRARVPALVTAVREGAEGGLQTINDSSLYGTATDLSREGVGLETHGRLASELLHVEFPTLSDLWLSFIVRIRWESPDGNGFRRSGGSILGVVAPTDALPDEDRLAGVESGAPGEGDREPHFGGWH